MKIKINKFRKEKKITQKELANKAGIALRRLGNYEREERMLPVDIAMKIGKVLEIDWWKLYEED